MLKPSLVAFLVELPGLSRAFEVKAGHPSWHARTRDLLCPTSDADRSDETRPSTSTSSGVPLRVRGVSRLFLLGGIRDLGISRRGKSR